MRLGGIGPDPSGFGGASERRRSKVAVPGSTELGTSSPLTRSEVPCADNVVGCAFEAVEEDQSTRTDVVKRRLHEFSGVEEDKELVVQEC